ncbi:Cullin-4B [Mycena olivaceomarginata]|nr:Cullin-4B [Mycena olivaceomarginata]
MSLLQLLTLPAHSKGFTAIPDTITDTESSPPHKTPRRDADSDSPSAARGSNRANQPIKIQVIGTTRRSKPPRPSLSLRQCIGRLLSRDDTNTLPPSEAIYSECFSVVCVSNTGEGLYEDLKVELEKAVISLRQELLVTPKPPPKFVETCQWFEDKVALLQSLLTYLDQVYVLRAQVPTIRKLAFSLFVRSIFENPELMDTLRNSVRAAITAERYLRTPFDHTEHIPSLISHLYTHRQYSVFEEFYRDVTWQYYEEESSKLAEKNDPKGFFEYIQMRIQEEVERSKNLLPVASWSIIRDATPKTAIGDYLDRKDFKNLRAMNQLFSDAEGDKVICSVFKSHLQKTVQSVVKDAAADDTMVQRLLECRTVADSAIRECFVEEPVTSAASDDAPKAESTSAVSLKPKQEFIYALTDAFALGFKARRNKPAEMIAKHLDSSCAKARDVFRGFYLRAMAKRLLLEKSASHDFELAVLKKLKIFSMGEEMFSELALSREAMTEYHNKLPTESEGHKLSVMVLNKLHGHTRRRIKKSHCPPDMQTGAQRIEVFYKEKPTILLAFNRSSELSFKEILMKFKCPTMSSVLTLQSRDIDDKDSFRFNDAFTDPRAKVDNKTLIRREESQQTQTAIDSERLYTLDAAIVRIMKAKKEIMHSNLVNATTDAVKNHFTPDVKTIKARIEKLMEQEYIRRDEDQPLKLIYVA